jgi:hypothetical protein
LDNLHDSNDPEGDDHLWRCLAITRHKLHSLDPTDVHLKIKAIWGDEEESWVRADALRVQDPYPLVVYAVKKKLTRAPGWEWTTSYLEDDDHLASMVRAYKSRVNGTQFMFGVEIPKNAKRALEMDKENGNSLWRDSIDKELEMINEFRTFRRLNPGETLPPEFKPVPYFIVFANKFDGRRKARLVANGNKTVIENEDVYSRVVGMETV